MWDVTKMYERFLQLLSERKVTPYRVHKDTGVSQSVLSSWKNGRQPIYANMKLVADYFDVSVEWIRGETDDRAQKNPPVTKDEGIDKGKRDLIEKIKNMDSDTVAALNALADTIIGKRESHTGDS